MSEEGKPIKPSAKHKNKTIKTPLRPVTDGHEFNTDTIPELERNNPSVIKEKIDLKNVVSSTKLDLNAPSYLPKKFTNKNKNNSNIQQNNNNNNYDYSNLNNNNNIPNYMTYPMQNVQFMPNMPNNFPYYMNQNYNGFNNNMNNPYIQYTPQQIMMNQNYGIYPPPPQYNPYYQRPSNKMKNNQNWNKKNNNENNIDNKNKKDNDNKLMNKDFINNKAHDFDLDYNAKGFKPKNPMPLKNKENETKTEEKKTENPLGKLLEEANKKKAKKVSDKKDDKGKKRKEDEEKKRKEKEEKKRKEEEEKKEKEMEEKKKKEEEEKKRKEMDEKKRKEEDNDNENEIIEKKYFIIFKNKKYEDKEYKYAFEYIKQFKNWKIAKENELIPKEVKDHFKAFKEVLKEGGTMNKKEWRNPIDFSEQMKEAEEYKQKLIEETKKETVKKNLRNYLNLLTKDNFDETKENILKIIKNSPENQDKFLEVLFHKAVLEKAYAKLYAKLVKYLDKDLPNKIKKEKKSDKNKKEISEMRDHLIDKCETIFQNKDNEYLKEYMEEKDPEEKEYKLSKLKKFVFGNVYFITELMNIKIISKKIGPSCLRHLFDRYNKEKDNKILREITLEAIIIFTDQFGSLIHREKEKKPNADLGEINNKIDECFNKLEKIKDEPNLVGHLKFKIINLIEKRKNNYVQTEFEKSQIAKSKKEVEKELEKEGILTQDFINKKILNGLKDYKESLNEEEEEERKHNIDPWKETSYLIEVKEEKFDRILEGYFTGIWEFIEDEKNIPFLKDYIRELIEYYKKHLKKQKEEIKSKIFSLFEDIRTDALDTPAIFDIYSYVIYILIKSGIMKLIDLSKFEEKKDYIPDINTFMKHLIKYFKKNEFKETLMKFSYVQNNKNIFEWVFQKDEENNEEEEEEEDDDNNNNEK